MDGQRAANQFPRGIEDITAVRLQENKVMLFRVICGLNCIFCSTNNEFDIPI